MAFLQRGSGRWGLVVAIVLALSNQAAAISQSLCSTINTGTTPTNSSIFQSNGLCQQFCIANYAFAIVQLGDCWCSNFAPAITVNLDECNHQCPGYPDDLCGASNLFGYITLNLKPSGTVSSGLSSSQSQSQSSSSTTSGTSSSATWTPTPIQSVQTQTGGSVLTVTITPTSPPGTSDSPTSKSSSNKLGTGGTVGLVIGLVALVAIVGALLFFWLRRRRQREAEEKGPSRGGSSTGMPGQVPSRTMSENSRYVLGTDGRQVVETWEPTDTPGSRRSRLVPVDPRLDPFAPVYQRGEGNVSRESVNTLRDDHDYSRRVHQKGPILRATNPDE